MKNILLLVHAHPVESGHFLQFGLQKMGFKNCLVYKMADLPEHFLVTPFDEVWHSFVGVGVLQATQNLSAILTEMKNSAIFADHLIKACVFIGSFGWYRSDCDLGQVLVAQEALLWDRGRLDKSCYTPQVPVSSHVHTDSIYLSYRADKTLSESLVSWIKPPFRESVLYGKVASCVDITTSAQQAQLMWEQERIAGENMEIAAIAHVCQYHQVPWAALLVATNWVNEQGHEDWLKNHKTFLERSF